MSETTSAALKLQQFKCPSCGQNITQLTPFKASVECPYCHQVSLNPLIVNKSMRLPERVIPFTVTQDDFGEQIIEALVDEKNLPLDLFNQITFDSLIKAYLPMYEYSGNFEATWSCDERYAVEKQRMRNNQVETYKEYKYRPAHGDAYGNFSILCLAYSGEDVPQELQDFASAIDNPGASSYEYDPSLMGLDEDQQIITLEMNLDPRKIWSTFGRQYVEQKAAEECGRQAPSDRKNLRTSAKIDLTADGVYTMVPFWFVYFFYNQERWHFITEGSGSCQYLSAPQSNAIKFTRWGIAALFLILAAAALFLMSDIITAAVFAGCAWRGTKVYDFINKKKRIAAACRAFPESNFAKSHS